MYISVGTSPWQYHYESENYELLTAHHLEPMEKCSFLKLSKKIELELWDKVPFLATTFLKQMVGILK